MELLKLEFGQHFNKVHKEDGGKQNEKSLLKSW